MRTIICTRLFFDSPYRYTLFDEFDYLIPYWTRFYILHTLAAVSIHQDRMIQKMDDQLLWLLFLFSIWTIPLLDRCLRVSYFTLLGQFRVLIGI